MLIYLTITTNIYINCLHASCFAYTVKRQDSDNFFKMIEYIEALLSLNLKCSSQAVPLPPIKLKILLTPPDLNHVLRNLRGQFY